MQKSVIGLLVVFLGFYAIRGRANSQESDDDGAKAIKFLDAKKIFKRPHRRVNSASHTANKPAPSQPPKAAESASAKVQVGVEYHIRVTRNGRTETVPPGFRFVDGDIVQLQYDLNEDSYVYVLQRTLFGESKGINSSRAPTPYKLLYPLDDQPHKLKAGQQQLIPPGDVIMKMDNEPGTEKLYVVLSPQPIGMSELVKKQRVGEISPTADDAAAQELARMLSEFRTNTQISASGSHDKNMFSEEASSPSKSMEYALSQDPSKPVLAIVTLQHFHPAVEK